MFTLKDWLKETGMNAYTLSKITYLSPGTICNILSGVPPIAKTVNKIVRYTRSFPKPITYDMFPKVYIAGSYEFITGAELFRRLMAKKLKK